MATRGTSRSTLALVTLVLTVFWALLGLQASCYERRGVTVQGVVLQKQTSRSKGAKYHVEYRFRTAEGEEVTGRSDVRVATWNDLSEGGPVTVQYVPGYPHVNHVPGQYARARTWFVLALAGAGLTVWLRRGRRG